MQHWTEPKCETVYWSLVGTEVLYIKHLKVHIRNVLERCTQTDFTNTYSIIDTDVFPLELFTVHSIKTNVVVSAKRRIMVMKSITSHVVWVEEDKKNLFIL